MNKTTPAVLYESGLLEDQTDCVFHELQLAIQWQRPSILFAIYNSRSIRQVAENALESRILEAGKTVIHFQNNDDDHASLAQFVSGITGSDDAIFFIDPVTGDGKKNSPDYLYKTLNSSRDQLIDRLIRVVFWLSENEAFNLARNAPDFWASRHRVIDFICPDPSESACPDQPAAILKNPLKEDRSANSLNVLLTLGVTQWKKGDHNKAIEFLQAALVIAVKSGDGSRQAICWKAIALVKSDAGRTEEAIQAYTHLIGLTSENITVWNNIGALYQKTGRFENAFQSFNNAIKKTPNNPVSWNGLGNVYKSTGRSADAIECYKKALKLHPGYVNPWVSLGDVYASLNQHDQSLKAYMRAATLDAKNASVWIGIGNVTLATHYNQQAIDAYAKAIEYGADPDALSAKLAAACEQTGDSAVAIINYQKAIEVSASRKDKAGLWSKLGDTYRRAGEYENAAAAYKMSDKLALGAENPSQGASRIDQPKTGKPAETSPALQPDGDANRALHLAPPSMRKTFKPNPASAPENAGLWIQLGNTYIKVGVLDRALDAFHKAASLDAGNGQTFVQIAHLYEQKNDPAQALVFHQKNLSLLSNAQERANSLGCIADLQRQMQDFASALQSIEAAASLDPENKTILAGLVKIHQDLDANLSNAQVVKENLNPPDPAAPAIPDQPLIDVNLDNANIWNELGNIFAKSSSFEDAIDAFERAIELDPEFGWSYSNLAQVYAIQGKYDQALSLYQKSIDLLFSDTDKAITWNRMGDVYRHTNQYPQAMQAYQNADRLNQDNIRLGSDFREIDINQPFAHFVL